MSSYKETPVTLSHVVERCNDARYCENAWFEFRIGDTVIGRGGTVEEAAQDCISASAIREQSDG